MSFDDLGLGPDLLRAVADAGYTQPTPIQEQAIPKILQGRDIIGVAQTGTGKTAGFTLPMIEILGKGRARARMPRSLILEPTRELAAQVADNFTTYGKYHKLNMALLIGGVSFSEQDQALNRGVDVLIATPGRLLDQFERGKILLADIKILVVDEADRMLDMGFIPDVERIIKLLPRTRQTLMFSATMATEIRRLADTYLTLPSQVAVAPSATTAENVTQLVVPVPNDFRGKRDALRKLLRREDVSNAIIFCNRKRDVSTLARSLDNHGFDCAALHGDMAQSLRTETLQRFKNNEIKLLIASDVAARGLDIARMSHVFNFDVPMSADDYVHRIGRTGRAGREGRAFTLASPSDAKYLAAIERLIGSPIDRLELEGVAAQPAAEVAEKAAEAPAPRRRSRRATGRGKATPSTPTPAPTATPAPAAEPEAISADTQAKSGSIGTVVNVERTPTRRNGRRQDTDEKIVGMGDHTPAFLLR
ncbi:MAG: DEAD/DEAH box helicase [Alphaproteobacteria bacterium]